MRSGALSLVLGIWVVLLLQACMGTDVGNGISPDDDPFSGKSRTEEGSEGNHQGQPDSVQSDQGSDMDEPEIAPTPGVPAGGQQSGENDPGNTETVTRDVALALPLLTLNCGSPLAVATGTFQDGDAGTFTVTVQNDNSRALSGQLSGSLVPTPTITSPWAVTGGNGDDGCSTILISGPTVRINTTGSAVVTWQVEAGAVTVINVTHPSGTYTWTKNP